MYAGGRGTDLDYELGFRWTNEATLENNDFAIANLGWHYHLGFGVEKNLKLAEEYYLKASNLGNEYAKEQLKLLQEDLENETIEKKKIIVSKNKGDQTTSDKQKLVGSYEGLASFDGYEYPVSIELSIDENNTIIGSYKSNNDFGGILYNGTLYNDRKLKIYWKKEPIKVGWNMFLTILIQMLRENGDIF